MNALTVDDAHTVLTAALLRASFIVFVRNPHGCQLAQRAKEPKKQYSPQ
jgi:hypothetical protein